MSASPSGTPNFKNRTLYHGDNLDFLRGMNSETVHLIATDPPFKKGQDFHATPDSLASGARFKDRWRWDQDVHEEWTDSIIDDWPAVWEVITAARAAYGDDMGAYLCWLGVRLMEMRRVLRSDGSIYLHIDYTAYAYAKCLLDAIFGRDNFRNEIIWVYGKAARGAKGIAKQFARNHDTILFYSRSNKWTFNPQLGKRLLDSDEARDKGFRKDERGWFKTAPRGDYTDESVNRLEAEGRIYRTRTGRIRIRYDLPVENGKVVEEFRFGSIWDDIHDMMHAPKTERTGFPTQKRIPLYERIILASSNKGDIVLDPFCGCATTPIAAERHGRHWVGMDIWDGAYTQVVERMERDTILRFDDKSHVTLPKVFYTTEPPTRTDDKLMAASNLRLKIQRPEAPWQKITHRGMINILAAAQTSSGGVICAGCGRVLEREFMQLDHILPKSDGGENHILNRVLLCGPCNRRKRNYLTLSGLVRENNKKTVGWMKDKARAKLAQEAAREKAEWVCDHFHTRECQDVIHGKSR